MTKRRRLPILPVDGDCSEIGVPTDMHNGLSKIASRRVTHLKGQLIFFNRSVADVLEAAYIQGMNDMAEAINRKQANETNN